MNEFENVTFAFRGKQFTYAEYAKFVTNGTCSKEKDNILDKANDRIGDIIDFLMRGHKSIVIDSVKRSPTLLDITTLALITLDVADIEKVVNETDNDIKLETLINLIEESYLF